jgi:hypothetical protein
MQVNEFAYICGALLRALLPINTTISAALGTADTLLKRGWEHNDACSLCAQTLETSFHLAVDCPFARQMWYDLNEPLLDPAPPSIKSIRAWWDQLLSNTKGQRTTHTKNLSAAAYVLWNI